MKIEELTVKVTYQVGLSEIDLPEHIYLQMLEAYKKDKPLDGLGSIHGEEACEWLNQNIEEKDCFECIYEIEDIDVK